MAENDLAERVVDDLCTRRKRELGHLPLARVRIQ